MRIVFDLRPLSIKEKATRGTGQDLRALLSAMAKQTLDDEILVLLAKDQPFESPAPHVLPVRFDWPYGDISRFFWWTESWKTGLALRNLKPDVYHVPDLYMPRGFGGKVVVTVHDCFHLPLWGPVDLFGRRYGWRWNMRFRFRYRLTWKALSGADVIVANSETTCEKVKNLFPGLSDKMKVVHWGIEDDWWDLSGDPVALLAPYELSRPLVLHVGGLESRKNPKGVFESFQRIRRLHPRAMLAMVGPPHGVRENFDGVRYLGFVSPDVLKALYLTADCLLFPSYEEGFGRPVIEALASGCPVVTSRGTATEEIAAGRAELIDPSNIDEIVEALTRVLGRPRPAPRTDILKYSDTARSYLEIYKTL